MMNDWIRLRLRPGGASISIRAAAIVAYGPTEGDRDHGSDVYIADTGDLPFHVVETADEIRCLLGVRE